MTPGEYTLANRGGTFRKPDMEPVTPKTGYAVSVVTETARKVYIRDESPYWQAILIEDALYDVAGDYDTDYVGSWIDPEGIVHVDPVTIIEGRGAAMLFAKVFRQQAIWDFANSEEISVS